MSPAISTYAELEALLGEIDARLAQRGVSIPWRPVYALADLGTHVGEDLDYPPPDLPARDGHFAGVDLVIRMESWFHARYGPKLQEYWGPGRAVFSFRGALWTISYPFILLWGNETLVFHTGTEDDLATIEEMPEGSRAVNILDHIEGFTEDLRRSLQADESQTLVNVFRDGYVALMALEEQGVHVLVRFGLGDHDASVLHLTGTNPNWGQAKWASSQLLEKTLKAFIRHKEGKFPTTHNLVTLAELAEVLGLPELDRGKLALVQCTPGVRYSDPPVPQAEAVTAHWVALELAGLVAMAF